MLIKLKKLIYLIRLSKIITLVIRRSTSPVRPGAQPSMQHSFEEGCGHIPVLVSFGSAYYRIPARYLHLLLSVQRGTVYLPVDT